MLVRKNSLLKLCLRVMLIGSMAAGILGAVAGTAKATTCTIGTPCTSGVTVTVGAGALSASTSDAVINSGNGVGLTGSSQDIPFTFKTSVIDGRGTGAGWKVAASATAITFGTGGPTSDMLLAAANPVVVSCAPYSTCSSVGGLTLPTGGGQDLVTAPVTLVDAPSTSGYGSYAITTNGTFTVPAAAAAGPVTGGAIGVTVSNTP